MGRPCVGFFVPDKSPETYEQKVKRAMSRARNEFGRKEKSLSEALADDDGYVQGCYHVRAAPTE